MGKFESKKKRKSKAKIFVILAVLLVLLAFLGIFVIPQMLYKLSGEEETTVATEMETQIPVTEAAQSLPEEVTVVEFPVILEGGKLKMESLFQFDGINPDCANQEGKNIASIMVSNTSDIYLAAADIKLVVDSGETLNFRVTDLPAGKKAMVFSQENASVATGVSCVSVECEAVFDQEASLQEGKVAVTVDGISITLQNHTDADISELVVYCRSGFGEDYFGGITYAYTVNNLPANGSATVDAVDCILGIADVVRIAINET